MILSGTYLVILYGTDCVICSRAVSLRLNDPLWSGLNDPFWNGLSDPLWDGLGDLLWDCLNNLLYASLKLLLSCLVLPSLVLS